MGDKAVDDAKKTLKDTVKVLKKKTKATVADAKELRCKKEELQKCGADKKQIFDVQKSLNDLEKRYAKELNSTASRLQRSLKKLNLPKEQQGGVAKWYREMLKKESGFDVGKGVKLWGDLDFEKGGATFIIKGKL